jgi:diguanylate cyclase (GGDEF)-like protein
MSDVIDFLKRVDIFSLLSNEEITIIVEYLHTVEIEEGQPLFREGEAGHELFIVKSGKIRVSIRLKDGKEKEITEFKPGDFFGEMSIFEDAPRSATCYATQPSQLFTLLDSDFYTLIQSHPSMAIKIMYRMSNITTRRLRNTGEFLSDMVLWGESARKRAITDELTGVYNRHFLEDALEDHFRRAKQNGHVLSLIMVDLDCFRSINDKFGHRKGDEIILRTVGVFQKHTEDRDIIARYGGDEFTIVLPSTGRDRALEIAERICREVSLMDISDGIRITTSQGVASFPMDAGDLESLRKRADEALYRAKELGRNRVVPAE